MATKARYPFDNADAVDIRSTTATALTPNKLFDITATIGSVYADPDSPHTPTQTAFLMIEGFFTTSQYTPNQFSFPLEDGRVVHMTLDVESSPAPSR